MDALARIGSPAHPGSVVKAEIVEAHGMSVTDAAHALRVTRPARSGLLNGGTHLSPEMAIQVEKAFDVPIERLMRMQNSFDIAKARKRAAEVPVAPFIGRPPAQAIPV